MSNRFVEQAKEQMGAVEELIKGLPGIRGYVDKEMRRDADARVRRLIVEKLDAQKSALFDVQKQLMSGGLQWLDNVDGTIQKLQILIDRIKTAPQGYAGLFDAVRIQEAQLDALHRFDVALMERVQGVQNGVESLAAAVESKDNIGNTISELNDVIVGMTRLFNRRGEAILRPELLMDDDSTIESDAILLDDTASNYLDSETDSATDSE